MSERKKVIHVKDLVIQAENVRIEPPRPRPRPVRPFPPQHPRFRRDEEVEGIEDESEIESSSKDE
ncbi:hypothetical protein [Radiobacillus deserti]|uniref:Uncharacterized protein n=1 Tax=Radiobacillus deserti TaxID=2594883 RepID=A0A516KEI2_9BACI|nr:hypothetical protein [Radiobacillus deserti]QDP39808.1 hypothetical protein FN924_06265 [Radiobacillus deserti]